MEIYAGATKENTVLLVIDPVNSCAHERCETPEWNIHYKKIRAMLPKLAKFVEEYRREVGGLVVLTTITPWTKEHLPENIRELYTDPVAYYYSDDMTGFEEEFHDVLPMAGDLVIAKNTYDAFSNEKLMKELKGRKIKYVVVAGIFTDGCVLASVVGGFSRGFNFIVLKDMVETTDDMARQELQKLLIEYTFPVQYGKTVTGKEFLQAWKRLSS